MSSEEIQQVVYRVVEDDITLFDHVRNELFTLHGLKANTTAWMANDDIACSIHAIAQNVIGYSDSIISRIYESIVNIVIQSIVEKHGKKYGLVLYDLHEIMRAVPYVFTRGTVIRATNALFRVSLDDKIIIAPLTAFIMTHIYPNDFDKITDNIQSLLVDLTRHLCVIRVVTYATYDYEVFRAVCTGDYQSVQRYLSKFIDEVYAK
jgi:hypothetical protein